MQDYQRTPQELGELRAAHRRVRDAREAYRLNAVSLLGTGWRVKDVAEALLIDPDTVRSHFQRFRAGGITALLHLNYVGSEAWLDAQQMQELDQHLRGTLYVICDNARYYKAKRVSAYLENSRIDLVPLPPYGPNLNLIERLWKFFKRQVLHNQ